jgi:PAS domain S-box-containing protein
VRSELPWMGGPAEQFVLSTMERNLVQTVTPFATAAAAPVVVKDTSSQVKVVTPFVNGNEGPAHSQYVSSGLIAERAESAHLQSLNESGLRRLLEVAADAILVLDKSGAISDSSFGANELLARHGTSLLQQNVNQYLSTESRKLLTERLQRQAMLQDSRRVEGFPLQAELGDGHVLPLYAILCDVENDQFPGRFALVLRDISRMQALENEKAALLAAANDHSDHTPDLLAKVNHELRSPLTAIMGFADVMREERFGPLGNAQYKAYADDIHNSGNHLLNIVNDLLDISQVEAGKMELNFTAVDICDVIGRALREISEEARTAKISLVNHCADGLPRVVADLRAMRQVMANLLSNAVKYTNAGGTVSVSASLNAQGEMIIVVRDTGIGMREPDVKRALEPFGRILTPGRERQGSGLGLPLTQALIEANRAQFRLASVASEGTSASITFPTTRVLAD